MWSGTDTNLGQSVGSKVKLSLEDLSLNEDRCLLQHPQSLLGLFLTHWVRLELSVWISDELPSIHLRVDLAQD